jgi:hypothetical protein
MAGFGPLLMVLGVVYALAISVVLQALSTIFQVGVYIYATSGAVPPTLDRDLVENAFRPKASLVRYPPATVAIHARAEPGSSFGQSASASSRARAHRRRRPPSGP